MGYTHYWYREKEISRKEFAAIVGDFKKLLPKFEEAGVKLAGPMGEGEPVINEDEVAFNGAVDCGHPAGYELVIPWPAPGAGGVFAGEPVVGTWSAGHLLATRACPGDCSYESFVFPRVHVPHEWERPDERGRWFGFCKTAFRPYDLAVTAFLLVAKRHLGDRIAVATDGEDEHWFDAKLLCQLELGYGLEYAVVEGELVRY
ncbi:hypothetical protein Adeg_0683 [Ammonifex degensii KC4]|uniref:Uncharacterized protein n=1 Tax=Ammonifex degensii (strain DSM 10501 / KC4) TaxID=429009 RepID=C9RC53_AMMDK|nr:hypothetical protein [Ammonifex degensii]ACX51830.1 hypothetical protein Adeg_0683 [Ammonifex degensii KC4]